MSTLEVKNSSKTYLEAFAAFERVLKDKDIPPEVSERVDCLAKKFISAMRDNPDSFTSSHIKMIESCVQQDESGALMINTGQLVQDASFKDQKLMKGVYTKLEGYHKDKQVVAFLASFETMGLCKWHGFRKKQR